MRIFYAVKANPAPEILARLAALGCSFDVASPGEIALALAAGADPGRISYGNTIKKEADIARAFARGVRLFAFDSEAELAKIARAAPGSRVFCRILTTGEGADWPLSRKFGCAPAMARELLTRAAAHGRGAVGRVVPRRLAAEEPGAWDAALAEAAGPVPRPRGRGHRARHGQSRRRLPDALPQARCPTPRPMATRSWTRCAAISATASRS